MLLVCRISDAYYCSLTVLRGIGVSRGWQVYGGGTRQVFLLRFNTGRDQRIIFREIKLLYIARSFIQQLWIDIILLITFYLLIVNSVLRVNNVLVTMSNKNLFFCH